MGQVYNNLVHRLGRIALALLTAFTMLAPTYVLPASAASGDRTLYLYYTHTKETGKFTFRRGGRYDKAVLAKLNRFLRDWRRNEPTKMDPALFDLVWEVYQESGASGPIHIVSAYRAPATNEMLRSKSRGVAKNSRHTQGMAIDFFIPGVKISKLRTVAMSKQVGGVGYYPTSGSPFVHLDTGNVRAWPRMTRAQLQKLFPNGKTLHVPTDGVPLSNKGYQLAKAEWQKCRSVPCNGRRTTSSNVQTARNDSKPQKNLFDLFFGEDDKKSPAVTVAAAPSSRTVTSTIVAPTPAARPGSLPAVTSNPADLLVASAPVPHARPQALMALDTTAQTPSLAVAAIDANAPPAPRTLLTRLNEKPQAVPTLTAYAPATPPAPDARRALDTLIQQRMAQSETSPAKPVQSFEIASDTMRTASLDSTPDVDRLSDLISSSWTAVTNAGNRDVLASTHVTKPTLKLETREAHLVAPDLEHITEIFADPRPLSSARYAVLFESDIADFDPATEMGQNTGLNGFKTRVDFGLSTGRFVNRGPLQVASR